MSEVASSDITIEIGDRKVRAHLAVPAAGSGPGVIVLHSWWGLNSFFESIADRLAAEGYIALAPDCNSGLLAHTIDEADALMHQIDPQDKSAAILSAIKYLKALPGVREGGLASIGFSAGAAWSLIFSVTASQDIKAVVLFYGAYSVDFTQARAAYLGHFAEHEEWESDSDIAAMLSAMRDAGRTATSHIYPGTSHWFIEEDRADSFHPEAAALAWERTLQFLKQQFE